MEGWENLLKEKEYFKTFTTKAGFRIFPTFLDWTNKNKASEDARYKLVRMKRKNYAARPIKVYFSKWKPMMEYKTIKKSYVRGDSKFTRKSELFRFNIFKLLVEYMRYKNVEVSENGMSHLHAILEMEKYRKRLLNLYEKETGAIEFIQNVLTAVRSGHQSALWKMSNILEGKDEELQADFQLELTTLQRKRDRTGINPKNCRKIVENLTKKYYYATFKKLPLLLKKEWEFRLLLLHFLISHDLFVKLGQMIPGWKRKSMTLDLVGI